MKIASVVGARPQFIKAAPVSLALSHYFDEVMVHTGQHYDFEMSTVFFDELELRPPDYNLEIGSGMHGWQTARMLEKLEEVLIKESPSMVMVYGDTNSTLAGSLAASKLGIPLCHVEAGCRSFNRDMPEELNRVVSDHLSNILFCSTQTAELNLSKEGIMDGVHKVGDVMYDVMLSALGRHGEGLHAGLLNDLGLRSGEYFLITLHRPVNTDAREPLSRVVETLMDETITKPVVFPVHPRTEKSLKRFNLYKKLQSSKDIMMMKPVGYLDLISLIKHSFKVMTDSGGVQKEAYMLGRPCITLREETEWPETLEGGWNYLAGNDRDLILKALVRPEPIIPQETPFGDGHSGEKIAELIREYLGH